MLRDGTLNGWLSPVMVADACILSNLDAEIRRIWFPGKYLERPNLQNNQSKMDWRCGSSGSMLVSYVWSPEFELQPD
jgi:hypothetical protein